MGRIAPRPKKALLASSRIAKSPNTSYLWMCLYTVALDTPTISAIFPPLIPNPYRVLIRSSLPQPTFLLLSLLERNICIFYLSFFPCFNELNNVWCSFFPIQSIRFSFIYYSDCRFTINLCSI